MIHVMLRLAVNPFEFGDVAVQESQIMHEAKRLPYPFRAS